MYSQGNYSVIYPKEPVKYMYSKSLKYASNRSFTETLHVTRADLFVDIIDVVPTSTACDLIVCLHSFLFSESIMAGRGRGRGLELTRPAWMVGKSVPPSLPKSSSTKSEPKSVSSTSEWQTATAPNGRTYWFNKTTNATSWTDPTLSTPHTSVPSSGSQISKEWREHRTPDGRLYFYNACTKETRWTRPGPPENAVPSGDASVQAPLPAGWAQNTAPNGRVYYYHANTRETRWTRPGLDAASVSRQPAAAGEVAKLPSNSLTPLPAGWIEYRAKDGRPYYYHAASKRTSWARPRDEASPPLVRPRDDKAQMSAVTGREPLNHREAHLQGPAKRPRIGAVNSAAVRANTGTHTFRRPRDSEGKPMSNRQVEAWLLVRAARRKAEKQAADVEMKNTPTVENDKRENVTEVKDLNNVTGKAPGEDVTSTDKVSAYEKKKRFLAMLDERGVELGATWFRAMCACVEDARYLSLPTYGERKTAFHVWSQKKMSIQRCEDVKKNLKASEDFLDMLKELLHNEPMRLRTIEDCRPDVVKRVCESKEYRALSSDLIRQGLTRAFFDNRKRDYERKKAEDRKRMLRTARETLDAMTDPSIRPISSRRSNSVERKDGEKETPMKNVHGPPWLNHHTSHREVDRRLSELPFYRELNGRDIKNIFQEWGRDVDKMVEEKHMREKEARKAQQRANRAKFREGVLRMILEGRISFRVQWREVASEIEKEEFACPESELGERPVNLFKDSLDDFDAKVHEHKEGFKELIRELAFSITDETTIESLKENEKLANFLNPLPKPIAEALLQDRKRKEHRRRQYALRDYEEMLRKLFRRDELKLDSTFDSAQSILESKEQMQALVAISGIAEANRSFDELIERRKTSEARQAKRHSNDLVQHNDHKRPRLHDPRARTGPASKDDDTGWAAAISAKPLSSEEKAAALKKKKKDLLESLKAGKSGGPAITKANANASVSPAAIAKAKDPAKPNIDVDQTENSRRKDVKIEVENGVAVPMDIESADDHLSKSQQPANGPALEGKEAGEI